MEETLECANNSLELWIADLPLGVSISMSIFMLFWTIGLKSVLVSKGNNVFANSLLGATIQDGGTRERSEDKHAPCPSSNTCHIIIMESGWMTP